MEIQTEATRKRTCAVYAGDMHALECHMFEAFERQLTSFQDLANVCDVVEDLRATSKRHIYALNELVTSLGDVEKMVTDKLKTAVAGLFGVAAGLVDSVRSLPATKALRDDYTALSHAIAGYVLLSTTATALQNEKTKEIAENFLNDYICLSHKVMAVLPSLAIRDLLGCDIHVLNYDAPKLVMERKEWSTLFRKETHSQQICATALGSTVQISTISPVVVEKTTTTTTSSGQLNAPVVETIVKPTVIKETFRPQKITEIQPIIEREVTAPEVHHIEKHIYEKVETGSATITNQPIVREVIKPVIVEEVQEIIHREVPAPYVEKVEKITEELEVLPTVHTKEVLLDSQEKVLKTDLLVKETKNLELETKETKVDTKETVTETTKQKGVAAGGKKGHR